MKIHVRDPVLALELAAYLRERGFLVVERGHGKLDVHLLNHVSDRYDRAETQTLIAEWTSHLGIARSPAFHYEPETNGCAEKAIQTLKEQLLWLERFETLDELRQAVRRFGRTYNQHWLIERHGYRTPIEAREHLRAQAAAAA